MNPKEIRTGKALLVDYVFSMKQDQLVGLRERITIEAEGPDSAILALGSIELRIDRDSAQLKAHRLRMLMKGFIIGRPDTIGNLGYFFMPKPLYWSVKDEIAR